mgnify:CR=1 FL=1
MSKVLVIDDSPTEIFQFKEMLEGLVTKLLRQKMVKTVLPWQPGSNLTSC